MSHWLPLIAIGGFGSIWMLLWSVAALVPLVIHLWNRSRYQEAPWAAMEYLLAALHQNARRVRLEQLLLLAIRMSIPIVLALALADPMLNQFPSMGTSLAPRRPRHVLLVIDGSYSMDYRSADATRFQRALLLAKDVVEESNQGDGFTLILMGTPPQVVVGSPAFDPDDIRAEIDGLALRHSDANLPDTLGQVLETLDSVKRHHPRLQRHQVYLFTDFGANTWRAANGPRAKARVARIDELADIALVDVGSDEDANLAITDLQRREEIVTTAGDVNFQVTVQNFSSQAREDHQVDLVVDGRLAHRETVDLAAHEEATIGFGYRFDSPGEHWVEARIGPDALEVDNHRYHAVPVRTQLRVLCVSGKPDSAQNVALALEPGYSDRRKVETRVVTENLLGELDPLDFDCIFLCNVGRFRRDEVALLHTALQNGRGLVFFLGDQVQADNYNLDLGDERENRRILPAKVGSVAPSGTYMFDPKDYRHPIISPFRGHERTGLLTTPIWRYFRLEPYPDTQARVALWFNSGDPAIVEESIGHARSILVATAASEQSVSRQGEVTVPWSALSSWPSFPPLIQEMLIQAAGTRFADRNLFVGQTLLANIPRTQMDLTVTVGGGDGTDRWEEIVRAKTNDDGSFWAFERTYESGIYYADYASLEMPRQNFAVNIVTTGESELSRIAIDDLPMQFRRRTILAEEGQPTDVRWDATPVFRFILSLLLVLVLLETLVAWYLGTARA